MSDDGRASDDDDSNSDYSIDGITNNNEVEEDNPERMRFCRECNNMLYPKEDRENKKLMYACRNCTHQEHVTSNKIYGNTLLAEAKMEVTTYPSDMMHDPTLQRTTDQECPKCHQTNAVFFQAHEFDNAKTGGLKLIYVCTNVDCGERWIDKTNKMSNKAN